jgi:microcin C transport system substrate-binding protein
MKDTFENAAAAAPRAVARWFCLVGTALVMSFAPGADRAAAQETIRAHGISTFGTLKYPADFAHLDYVNPAAPKGGEISVWAFGGFDSMNPYSIKGRSGGLASVFYESLLVGTSDEVGANYCLVCESLEYPPGREWVIFRLRPEVRFSDGTPLTADDVIFSYETFLAKGLSDFRVVLSQQVERAEALDALTVKFTFREGFPTRDLPAEVGGIPILSKADYLANNRDLEESSLQPFVGSGPYVLERVDVGQTLVYRRNPDWWARDLPINRGRANFDRIRVEYFADYNAAFEGFKAGAYTFRNEASSISWATGYDFPAVQAGHVRKVELPSGAKAPGQAFLFNLRRDTFQDPRVREAIGLMFNFEWSNATLFYGLYARIHSIWENSHLAAEGPPSEAEAALLAPLVAEGLLPASILTDPAVMAPASGDRQLDRNNLRLASELLDAAGWPVGSDGLRRNPAGKVLRVEFLNDSQSFERIINPFVENLRRLGVDAVHSRVDNAQMELRTRPPAYDFDIITGNARGSLIPGPELMQFYGSQTADVSAFNVMGLKSVAADRLIDAVIAADSDDALRIATQALDRVLRAERFWVPQWFKDRHTIAYYDMYRHPETLPPYALGELDFWWFDAAAAERLRAAGALRN